MSRSIALQIGHDYDLARLDGTDADPPPPATHSGTASMAGDEALISPATAGPASPEEFEYVSEDDWDSSVISDNTLLLRRFELPIQLTAGLSPALAIWALQDRELFSGAFSETLIILLLASFISWYILARVRAHAKARHLSYVLPINSLVFSGAIAIAALLRLPYSSSLFLVGASSTMLVSFLLAVRNRGLMKPHIIVPGGRTSEIRITGRYLPAPSASDLSELVRSGRRDWASRRRHCGACSLRN